MKAGYCILLVLCWIAVSELKLPQFTFKKIQMKNMCSYYHQNYFQGWFNTPTLKQIVNIGDFVSDDNSNNSFQWGFQELSWFIRRILWIPSPGNDVSISSTPSYMQGQRQTVVMYTNMTDIRKMSITGNLHYIVSRNIKHTNVYYCLVCIVTFWKWICYLLITEHFVWLLFTSGIGWKIREFERKKANEVIYKVRKWYFYIFSIIYFYITFQLMFFP